MKHLPLTAFTSSALLLLAAACGSPPPEEPAEPTPTPEEVDEAEVATFDPLDVELDEPAELLDGLTLRMLDLLRDSDEDGEGYVAWQFEITNDTGETVPLHNTSSCFVGDPLEEAEQPVLGESVNPPETLRDGQSAQWDADCRLTEEHTALQYTIEFFDADSHPVAPQVTFIGDVEAPVVEETVEEPPAPAEQSEYGWDSPTGGYGVVGDPCTPDPVTGMVDNDACLAQHGYVIE